VAVRLLVSAAGKWVCFGVILFAEGASGGVAWQSRVSPSMKNLEGYSIFGLRKGWLRKNDTYCVVGVLEDMGVASGHRPAVLAEVRTEGADAR
jgi:hypothetical protein